MTDCRVCGSVTEPVFQSEGEIALLSSAIPVSGLTTSVDLCPACGHAQTRPIMDLARYYSSEYKFRIDSADEDDLYERRGQQNIFRSDHQARLAGEKLDLRSRLRVLDFGCGKALSLKILKVRNPGIEPFVFDVSDSYRPFWDKFVPPEQQASFNLPDGWRQTMDVVLSFFSLEHVSDPHGFLASVHPLLRPGGRLFLIVPNVLANFSDMISIDHINHFSATSLELLFAAEGFTDVRIDADAYRGAFVVTASRADRGGRNAGPPRTAPAAAVGKVREIAGFWKTLAKRITEAESSSPDGERSAIYGTGIYGLFIGCSMRQRHRVRFFVDQNPYRQRLSPLDIPVIAPEDIPDDVTLVYVGLNPSIARQVVAGVDALGRVPRTFFFP